MEVLGIGIDLVDIARMERMIARHGDRILLRLLTDNERAYVAGMAHPARHVAVRVAAKEAAYKAFQSLPDARPVSWHELETERNIEGRPSLRLHGLAAELAALHGPLTVHLSLTHGDTAAAAVALLVRP